MEHKQIVEKLRELESEAIKHTPSLPGLVDFAPSEIFDVAGELPDGVHRLDGSLWQFTVLDGQVVRATREDLKHFWHEPYTAYLNDDAPAPQVEAGGIAGPIGSPIPAAAPIAAEPKPRKPRKGAPEPGFDPSRPE